MKTLWGIALLAVSAVLTLNAFGITNIEIFFDGWWTLFIIVGELNLTSELSGKSSIDYGVGETNLVLIGTADDYTLSAYILGAHTLTTRYLKCPHCGKKSFCKRKLAE